MSLWIRRAVILLVWILVWQVACLIAGNLILLASPLNTAVALFNNAVSLDFWLAITYSLIRIAAGFSLAFLAALVFGALAWRFSLFSSFFTPAMSFIKSVPIVCIIVLLLMWFGAPYVSAVAVFLVVFPALYFSVYEGLRHKDEKLNEMLQVFKMGRLQKLLVYYWPTLLPFLTTTSKLVVGISWKSGVAAELIGLPLGSIGERIYMAKITLSSADLFTWILVIVAISILCERLFLRLLKNTEHWAWRLALSRCRGQHKSKTGCVQALQLKTVSKAFLGEVILDGFSFVLKPAACYALQGPSGSGKTTFLRLLAGLDVPDSGTIDGADKVSMVFQEARLFEQRTALDNLRIVAGRERGAEELKALLLELLPRDSLLKPVGDLSGGMRRRVELCRALAVPSQVLLLDEPFAGLDDENRSLAQSLLRRRLEGRILVIATHVPEDAEVLDAQTISFRV
ncbi:MAG: ATP-binding cassette domain-containing protein [Coriobacteriales bacterium]|jgi:NitT/TauT family transport system permease protein|nr:ATP-binding cassette domain-containing protein [Coriobacteriales bacterium]